MPLVSAETQGLVLGYLDSNQEQMIAVGVAVRTCIRGRLPRNSAVLMGFSVRAVR